MFLILLLVSYCCAFREFALKGNFYTGFDDMLSNFQFHLINKNLDWSATFTVANFGVDNNVDWYGPSSGYTYNVKFNNLDVYEDSQNLFVYKLFNISFDDNYVSIRYDYDDVHLDVRMFDPSGIAYIGKLNYDVSVQAYQQLVMTSGYFMFKGNDYIKFGKGRMLFQLTSYDNWYPALTMQVGVLAKGQNPSVSSNYINYYIHGYVTKSYNTTYCPQPYSTEILTLLVSTNYQNKIINYQDKGTLVKTKCLNPEYNTTYANVPPLPPNTIFAQDFTFTFDDLVLDCNVIQPSGIGEPIANILENTAQYHMRCYTPSHTLYSWYREF